MAWSKEKKTQCPLLGDREKGYENGKKKKYEERQF